MIFFFSFSVFIYLFIFIWSISISSSFILFLSFWSSLCISCSKPCLKWAFQHFLFMLLQKVVSFQLMLILFSVNAYEYLSSPLQLYLSLVFLQLSGTYFIDKKFLNKDVCQINDCKCSVNQSLFSHMAGDNCHTFLAMKDLKKKTPKCFILCAVSSDFHYWRDSEGQCFHSHESHKSSAEWITRALTDADLRSDRYSLINAWSSCGISGDYHHVCVCVCV